MSQVTSPLHSLYYDDGFSNNITRRCGSWTPHLLIQLKPEEEVYYKCLKDKESDKLEVKCIDFLEFHDELKQYLQK